MKQHILMATSEGKIIYTFYMVLAKAVKLANERNLIVYTFN